MLKITELLNMSAPLAINANINKVVCGSGKSKSLGPNLFKSQKSKNLKKLFKTT